MDPKHCKKNKIKTVKEYCNVPDRVVSREAGKGVVIVEEGGGVPDTVEKKVNFLPLFQ
jgi:hypothetical protein